MFTKMEQNLKEWDIVVFGATGFTGHFVVEELARVADHENLSWAVAGRKMHKIQNMLDKTGKRIGKDLDNTQIIIADVYSETSLKEMCQKTKLLINCVGPYNYHGDAVIKACLTENTDQVDICGESFFLEKAQLLYDKSARDAGVYIVGGCGYDSIPAEMGVLYTQQQFKGELHNIDNFTQILHQGAGIRVHAASMESFLVDLGYVWDRRTVRSQLFPTDLPRNKPHPNRFPLFYHKPLSSWCLPLINADISCVERSQSYFYEKTKKRPVEFRAYLCRPHIFWILGMLGFGLVWGMFGLFSWGRKLLCTFPRFFTAGVFSHKGPSIEQIEGTSFVMTFEGYGYSGVPDEQRQTSDLKPDAKLVTRVTGPDMGYVTTPICLVQAAVVLLKEREKLPAPGGVFPPGAAFAKTNLIHRLNSHNVKFSIVENP